MIPVQPEPRNNFKAVIFAKDQPQYLQLPANTDGHHVETKWQLTWRERFRILLSGQMYLTFLTFGNPLQPTRLSVLRDEYGTDGLIGIKEEKSSEVFAAQKA